MKKRTYSQATTLALTALFAVALVAATQPLSAAQPPVNRTYFIVALGVATDAAEVYQLDVGCLTFTRSELCDADGDCGVWWRLEDEVRTPRQWATGFEFFLTDDETGLPIHVIGRGRIDGRGPKSSLAAVAHGVEATSGTTINFAVAGRAVGPRKCERLVAEYEANLEEGQGGSS